MKTLSWVGVAGTGVLAVAAGITGGLALSASSKLQDMTYAGDRPGADVQDQRSRVKTLALSSDILTGAAIVTFGVTLYCTLTRHPAVEGTAAMPRVGIGLGPGNAFVGGSF